MSLRGFRTRSSSSKNKRQLGLELFEAVKTLGDDTWDHVKKTDHMLIRLNRHCQCPTDPQLPDHHYSDDLVIEDLYELIPVQVPSSNLFEATTKGLHSSAARSIVAIHISEKFTT